MQLQLVSDGTFRKVRNNIDRFFDKNLTDLIRGIRNNKENESRYIASCIEEIKAELRQDSTFVKANAVEKLAYLQMLGYNIGWSAFNIIEVMASTKFNEKRTGYLAATQAFNDETDVLMLATNLVRKDLQSSSNIYDVGVALSGLACFVTTDLARDLVNDIVNLLSSSRPYVRKKALLLLYKIFLKYPESLRSTFPRLKERLEDQDPGVQSAAVNVVCELARKNPHNYLSLQNVFFKLLNTSSNNWMLIKIIKLFGSLVPFEPKLGRRLLEPLTNLINSTSAMSLLYECINTVIAILISISSEGPGDYTPSIQLCVQKLGVLIDDSDQNLKYLGLLAMGRILQTHPKAVQAHKDIVLRCLDDKDESIRLRALDLLYGMISKRNIMEIVRKLMEHLDAAEGSFYRDELLRRVVAICAHDNYKYITNFEWYISVLVELTKVEGTKHGTLIADQIQDVAVRVQSVRHFAVSQMVLLVQNAQPLLQGNSTQRRNMAEVLLAAAWICGEFAQHVNDIPALLDSMLRLKLSVVPGPLLSVYLQNMAKLYALQLCRLEADDDWDAVESLDNLLSSKLPEFQFTDHLEAQERACNLMSLLKFAIEKHAERMKIGATLAKCFDGELNPVAAKAQRKVPVPDGLDLDAWVNEPELSANEDEEEEEGWELDQSEEEEKAVGRVLSPADPSQPSSHYGAGNLPQHGRQLPIASTGGKHAANRRDQSPTSYHRQQQQQSAGTTVDNGGLLPTSPSGKGKKARKESAETLRKRREFELENNPFYVKDSKQQQQRPSQMPSSAAAGLPRPKNQPEVLQSPLEIAGVVGLERYLQQKDATLNWKAVGGGKKKKTAGQQKSMADQESTASGGKRRRKKKGSDEGEVEGGREEEEPEAAEHFVYKGDGEMPEGALSSSEEEKLNDEFQALDIDLGIAEVAKSGKRHRKSLESSEKTTKTATARLHRTKEHAISNKEEAEEEKKRPKRRRSAKKSIEETAAATGLNEDGEEQAAVKKKGKTKKSKEKLGKKASLRKEYASIDSPTGGAAGNVDEQLISLDDVVGDVGIGTTTAAEATATTSTAVEAACDPLNQ